MCQRLIVCVCDRKRNIRRAKFLRKNRRLTVELNCRTLAFRTHNLDISPANAVVPSSAESFHAGFFCGESGGITFIAIGFGLAVGNLALSKDAPQEALAFAVLLPGTIGGTDVSLEGVTPDDGKHDGDPVLVRKE